MTTNECIFCRIIAGDAPSARVYEDQHVLAFMDIFPAARGHTLVVPKAHHETVFDMPAKALSDVAVAVGKVTLAIRAVLHPDGLNITQANGVAAGQSVPHYHVHLVPRTEGVRVKMHGSSKGDDEAIAKLARQIAHELSN